MYEQKPLSRRSFLQSVMGLLGLASVAPLRSAFARERVFIPKEVEHRVVASVTDSANRTWIAQTHVSNDPKTVAKYVKFIDAAGDEHPGLTAWFYADGCEVGACRFDNAHDFINCKLSVTYDGIDVALHRSSKADGTVDFWRGCRGPMIRYGEQAPVPTSADINWSLLPSYAKQSQVLFDDSRFDYSFNGLGCATERRMGSTGERADIGYMSQWNMGFICSPNASSWAVVRRADDHAGVWPIYYCNPETGKIVDRTAYPDANFMPSPQQGGLSRNPVVNYGGTYDGKILTPPASKWKSTGCPFFPNSAHLTSYALLSAMLTKTARDKDHASFWSNYVLMDHNPKYVDSGGVLSGAQRRAAWALRNIFMASYVSADMAYFKTELDRELTIANAMPKNAFGILLNDTLSGPCLPYRGIHGAIGYRGMAPWMQAYVSMSLDAISYKLPAWKPFAQYIGKFFTQWYARKWALMSTLYNFFCVDPSGALMTDFTQMAYYSWLNNGLSTTEATSMLNAATVQDAYTILKAHYTASGKSWGGKCISEVSDFHGNIHSASSYPADQIAAVTAAYNAGAPGADAALAYVQALPTKPGYTRNQKYHLVPRSKP